MLASLSASALNSFLDRFIPPGIGNDRELRKQVRMFLISHLFGPFIGNVIPIALFLLDPTPSYEIGVLAVSITSFWLFPLVLKFTGHYFPLALISIQNLIFCILWSCFFYGGVTSPTLAWVLSIPLLSFFYVGSEPRLRLVVLGMFAVNFAVFYVGYKLYGHAPDLDPAALQGLGLISTFAAATYVAMMAVIYAKILASQSELEQEGRQHLATVAELRRATEDAERASNAKAEFLARMSHELRTPLNAVIGFSDILIEESTDNDPETAADLTRINAAGKHLLSLVNKVLDLSRLEANRVELDNAPFDVRPLLDDVLTEFRDRAERRGTVLDLDVAAGAESMTGDAAKVRQVVAQLVENAVKFTRDGTVSVSVHTANTPTERLLAVRVEDTGVGIAAERMPHIFEQFAHGGDQVGGKHDGSGLGLGLARKLSQLMGGDIAVRSRPGQGSAFTVTLPREGSDRAAERRDTQLRLADPPRLAA